MTAMTRTTVSPFQLKDPISSLTHFAGFLLTIPATSLLLVKAGVLQDSMKTMIGLAVFMGSMSLLYAASAAYHAFEINPKANALLRRIDHCSIFILIAGSYTPVCLTALSRSGGILLSVIWTIAVLGIIFKIFWITHPKVLSSLIYIMMGWACISVVPQLYHSLGSTGFAWLLAGGLFYTVGGVLYSMKLNLFPNGMKTGFGNHELFHLFVMAGSFCHFMMAFTTLTLIG